MCAGERFGEQRIVAQVDLTQPRGKLAARHHASISPSSCSEAGVIAPLPSALSIST